MDENTSINFIYPDLWAPVAGLLQGSTVIQQCVYQVMFGNVCEVKKWIGLVWSKTLSILWSMNGVSVFIVVFA